ncbi:ubiquilin [Anaeramoeba ignava]|uniref:Ubiquilin n=1 Tax=Anaeramoeba ignava TaxID=1746090 RepID=A0A9Q0LUY6_ANAIG|nr:ubiquilin [Anaeramoeba ignava]
MNIKIELQENIFELIEIQLNWTIKELKDLILKKIQINFPQFSLVFNDKILEENKTIEFYNITEGSIIKIKEVNEKDVFGLLNGFGGTGNPPPKISTLFPTIESLQEVSNDSLMQDFFDLVQDKPEYIEELVSNSPEMQILLKNDSDFFEVIHDSKLLQSSILQNEQNPFQNQLQALIEMGFQDTNQNLQALITTNGNLENSIELILSQK